MIFPESLRRQTFFGGVYTASARSTRPSAVIAFPRTTLAALMEDDHFAATLTKKLAGLLSRRLRDTQVQLLSLTARQHTWGGL